MSCSRCVTYVANRRCRRMAYVCWNSVTMQRWTRCGEQLSHPFGKHKSMTAWWIASNRRYLFANTITTLAVLLHRWVASALNSLQLHICHVHLSKYPFSIKRHFNKCWSVLNALRSFVDLHFLTENEALGTIVIAYI